MNKTNGGENGIDYYQKQSITCFNNEKYSDCIKHLNQVLQLKKGDLIALYNRATCNFKLELYKHCIKDCDLILQIEPENKIALLRKSKALNQLSPSIYKDDIKKYKELAKSSWGYLSVSIKDGDDDDDDDDLLNFDEYEEEAEQYETVKENIQQSNNNETTIIISSSSSSLLFNNEESNNNNKNNNNNNSNSSDNSNNNSNSNSLDSQSNNNNKITKSNSMEELNQLLEQLSTENISILVNNGYYLVNNGNYQDAIEIFSTIISSNPLIPSTFLGRGTSFAFIGELQNAIRDFTKAIELDNTSSDAYKRRGQSKVALGQEYEALEDFNQAVVFDKTNDYDIYYNRGLLHYQMRNYERALKDFRKVVTIDSTHKLAWNRIGLCLNVNGYPFEANKAFYKSLEIDPQFEASYTNIGQSWKDIGNYDKSFEAFSKALQICPNYSNALHLRGLLFFNSGKYQLAIKDWSSYLDEQQKQQQQSDPSLSSAADYQSLTDVRQLRGVAYHTVGQYRQSVQDYNNVIQMNSLHYSFYLREWSLFLHHNLDRLLVDFNIDRSLNPYLKTFQCQKIPPTSLIGYHYQQPINANIQDVNLKPELDKETQQLVDCANQLGSMLQYQCEGFLPNSRQKLQCGLAIIEIAQTLKTLWSSGSIKSSEFLISSIFGSTISSSSENNSGNSQSQSNTRLFGWRDLYDIGVKWRQLSEPNDPVWWVDLLSPEQFKEGFGSHTPIVTGQCKVPRYYSMFDKSLEIMKLLLPIQHPNYSTMEFMNELSSVKTCKELYKLVKKDLYVVTPCYSRCDQQKIMEGTRLTLQYVHPEGYEFAIRTPGTPERWSHYDQEMTSIWNELVNLILNYYQYQKIQQQQPQPADKTIALAMIDKISELILTLSFYWYNFMPLSRGSAAIGLTVLLGLFLSIDIRIINPIPKGQQPDWEAILRPNPDSFLNVLKPWIFPSRSSFNISNLPQVSKSFNTIRKVIEILNTTNK
ncbi:hypothetical protein CYY_004102 [Polysphondylium violaceum]|uniref:TPR repeat-containing protein n=1 Tax=Polysphondylium violaceum TaxID=133409 RepID=A0A8J4UZK7_9MYCE|nr:hypothetical protein CYY_004102 [Polysphondylium violaceum]